MKRNILLLFTFFACITVQGQTPVRLVDLRSEHLDRPIGLDNPVPRLSWRMEDGRQGAVQTSWRIVVDEDSLNVVNGCGRMWDSGKIPVICLWPMRAKNCSLSLDIIGK